MSEKQINRQPITAQPGHGEKGMEKRSGGSHHIHASDLPPLVKGEQPPWMPVPPGGAGCPPGLEYLTQIDQLILKQRADCCEAMTNCEMKNTFRIFNNLGQQVYFAREESKCCHRFFCGNCRGFKMHITDNENKEVITIERQFKCCAGWCCCADSGSCSMEVYIKDSQGQVIGHVMQRGSKWKAHYLILDGLEQPIGRIRGPCCVCSWCPGCGDVPFPITDADEKSQIGEVTKQWSGVCKEFCADADNFSVTFPLDLDPRCKAAFLGACFLIDYMYFEKDGNNSND